MIFLTTCLSPFLSQTGKHLKYTHSVQIAYPIQTKCKTSSTPSSFVFYNGIGWGPPYPLTPTVENGSPGRLGTKYYRPRMVSSRSAKNNMAAKISGVLIDLSGTIHVENTVIPGSIQALKRYFRTKHNIITICS